MRPRGVLNFVNSNNNNISQFDDDVFSLPHECINFKRNHDRLWSFMDYHNLNEFRIPFQLDLSEPNSILNDEIYKLKVQTLKSHIEQSFKIRLNKKLTRISNRQTDRNILETIEIKIYSGKWNKDDFPELPEAIQESDQETLKQNLRKGYIQFPPYSLVLTIDKDKKVGFRQSGYTIKDIHINRRGFEHLNMNFKIWNDDNVIKVMFKKEW